MDEMNRYERYINKTIDYLQRIRFVLYVIAVIAPLYIGIVGPEKGPLVSIFAAIVSAAIEIKTQIDKKHSEVMDELKYHPGGIKCPGDIEKIKCPIHIKAEAITDKDKVYDKLLELAKGLDTNDKVHVTDRNYEKGLDEYFNILKDQIKNKQIELSRYIFLSRDEKDEKNHNDRLDKLNEWLKKEHELRRDVEVKDLYKIYCTILPYFYNCICVYPSDATKDSKVMIGMNDAILPHGMSRRALYLEGSHSDLAIFINQFNAYIDAQGQGATKIYDGGDVKDIYMELKKQMGL